MLYFEWRRIFRQKLRKLQLQLNSSANSLTYKQVTRTKLIFCGLFFVLSWKLIGMKLVQDYFYVIDEETGERRMHTTEEIRNRVFAKREQHNPFRTITGTTKPNRPPVEISKTTFDLDA